jgi:hypothetical protein
MIINDNTFYTDDVAPPESLADKPYSTLVVSGADEGIDNKLIKLADLKTKQKIFGKSNFLKYGQPSLQAETLLRTGQCNVWFMRVLPKNATYANLVIVAKYRINDILNDEEEPTGKKRLEVKFDVEYAAKPTLTDGAMTDLDLERFARALTSEEPDPLTNYYTVPICYIRSTGRGRYGDKYAIRINRDIDTENDYGIKTYAWSVIKNDLRTEIINTVVGSLVSTNKYDYSTLTDDIINRYEEGASPIKMVTFEDSIDTLFEVYQKVIQLNEDWINTPSNYNPTDVKELKEAKSLIIGTFDPFFGLKMNTRANESIPYFKSYTVGAQPYVPTDYTAPLKTSLPLTVGIWHEAAVGKRVEVTKDTSHSNYKWIYTVAAIDGSGNITYDEGVREMRDAIEYNGVDFTKDIGIGFTGGNDGDFQQVYYNGKMRPPTSGELKLLLSKEYVQAFRGKKDRYIVSPTRVPLNFILDANYNLSITDVELEVEEVIRTIYENSTVVTDDDMRTIAIVETGNVIVKADDINVKAAMFDLNNWRNKNGNVLSRDIGAGCHLYLDCGVVGMKNLEANQELSDLIDAMFQFDNRNTSVDLGYYTIIDPVSGRKVNVTSTFLLAEKLVPHCLKYGINKPMVNALCEVTGHIKNSFFPELDLVDHDVMNKLYQARINYYVAIAENRYQRACQNTCQRDPSALLEENNARVLDEFVRILQADCRSFTYQWNEPTTRQSFEDATNDKFRPWSGTMVQDIKIRFEASEYEQQHMMMHCYASVAFRDIIKRIILEIDINRPNYSTTTGGEE